MEVVNATQMSTAYTLGMDPTGREHVLVIVKGTFNLPLDGRDPALVQDQLPPVMADEFTGKPGFSATVYESEFALVKPRCDVLLNGSAYAPGGRPADRVQVSLRVGAMRKSFHVVGDRLWRSGVVGPSMGKPKPFRRMAITYDKAFGGTDQDEKRPEKNLAYMKNPIGTGFYPFTRGMALEGRPLPNTEELNNPVNSVNGRFFPMSFGPIGRNFESRIALAGTYDQNWQDNVFPFLPADFDPLYFQSAPADQQIDYPTGGEAIELINLAPRDKIAFRLPAIEVPVEFTDESFKRTEMRAPLDTILIEPDLERLILIWRVSAPLRRGLNGMKQCVVGRMSKGWYRARDLGKNYYPSLRRAIANNKGASA